MLFLASFLYKHHIMFEKWFPNQLSNATQMRFKMLQCGIFKWDSSQPVNRNLQNDFHSNTEQFHKFYFHCILRGDWNNWLITNGSKYSFLWNKQNTNNALRTTDCNTRDVHVKIKFIFLSGQTLCTVFDSLWFHYCLSVLASHFVDAGRYRSIHVEACPPLLTCWLCCLNHFFTTGD